MTFKSSGKTIYKVDLTAKEQQALNREIKRQLQEMQHGYMRDYSNMVLWALHTKYGFAEKRLKEFYQWLCKEQAILEQDYQASNGAFVATYNMRNAGFNIDEWDKEMEK